MEEPEPAWSASRSRDGSNAIRRARAVADPSG
jgi:hypothetical protein